MMTKRTNNPRLIVLDTETTGLNPQEGHRIIEIGCIELVNRRHTGQRYHVYLNPDRQIDAEAVKVHGITNDFLADKQRFSEIYNDFFAFINGAELIIHNAPFDVGFINHEFSLLSANQPKLEDICSIFDTLTFARSKHPGQRNSLDALCKRYNIDNSHRELHGALLDAEILADLYLVMTGGQFSLLDETEQAPKNSIIKPSETIIAAKQRPPLTIICCDDEELTAHQALLDTVEKSSGHCIWRTLEASY